MSFSHHLDAVNSEVVSLVFRDGLATLCLNSPGTRNVIGGDMIEGLLSGLDQLAREPGIRVAVICAEGPIFCPGADMNWLRPQDGGAAQRMDDLLSRLQPLVARLRELPMVVVAAVQGAVAGGGFGLMNAADLVIASSETKFNLAYSHIGATPDLGATFFLSRLLGERRALELMLLSESFDAQRACELGLVNFVVPTKHFRNEVQRLLQRLLAGPPNAHAAIKRLTYQAHASDLLSQLDRERQQLVASADGDEFLEGVRAFMAKRAPRFNPAAARQEDAQ